MYKVNDYVQVVCTCNEYYGEFGVIQVVKPALWREEMTYGIQLENGNRDWFSEEELMIAVESSKEEPVTVINSGEEFEIKSLREMFDESVVNATKISATDATEKAPPTAFDNVERPKHYLQGNLEVIDILEDQLTEEEFRGFLRGNIIKYNLRYRTKNGVEDLKKANWYLDRLTKLESKEK